MIDLRPVTARLRHQFRPAVPMFDAADSIDELEPASAIETAPAISLPNEIDRVSNMVGDEDLHRARLRGGVRHEGPTLSYEFKNALIADSTVYANGTYQVFRDIKKRPLLLGKGEDFERGQLCTTVCAQLYFGHFFHDALPLEELAASRGIIPLTFERKPWLHEPGYRQLFDRQAVATGFGKVGRLSIVDERNLNAGWVARFAALRDRLRAKVTPTGATNVFISRGKMFSGRTLRNEPEIAATLEKLGFTILEPEKETPATIASVLSGADLVICVGGSAFVHALVALPAGATLIEIHLPRYFGTIGKTLSESAQLKWGYVVADEHQEGFVLQPKRLLQTLELVT